MNSVQIIGNLGDDGELKYTQGGSALLRLRVAVNDTWKDRDGNKQQKTHWMSCVLWGKRAEALHPHVNKGDKIGIEGSLEQRSWEDQNGNRRSTIEIKVRDVTLLGSPRASSGDRPPPSSGPPSESGPSGSGDYEPHDFGDSDIPF